MQIAILLYPGTTALDAVGPYEVLSRMPETEIRFVGKQIGPLVADGEALLLGVTHTLAETPTPDLVLVPGAMTTPTTMVDKEILAWLRTVHETTTWTTSVCSGALILAAAGILKGQPATTHWVAMGPLKMMGATPRPDERIVRAGKVVTAAGVSAGIDLGLWLVGEIAGRELAEAIQLTIEYDPQPPFDAGHLSKASNPVRKRAKRLLDDRTDFKQTLVKPLIAWNRLIDRVRTGK
ncbi:glutamine amidotransferase [Acrocarpospora pleiomorpha]|uniref:Glutamine amidotransferase n=1 Tax=Acrocarpospora pleiomorpha TaxID=90975 RepID=A0A5M3XKK5_9ACTN|nr:DJ-1/PfpI family protein [Acrocarpospora pleiomorpha]GES19683.1 glutamine amidotransferase [Acrocarpospora pleiomorpha]